LLFRRVKRDAAVVSEKSRWQQVSGAKAASSRQPSDNFRHRTASNVGNTAAGCSRIATDDTKKFRKALKKQGFAHANAIIAQCWHDRCNVKRMQRMSLITQNPTAGKRKLK
jgi:hypothetical protein